MLEEQHCVEQQRMHLNVVSVAVRSLQMMYTSWQEAKVHRLRQWSLTVNEVAVLEHLNHNSVISASGDDDPTPD